MADPSSRPEGSLTTAELVEKIHADLGLLFSRATVRMWADRPENPLPLLYRGKNGQAHYYDWLQFLEWFEAEQARDTARQADDAEPDIDQLDWHGARTVSARAQAKKDQILAKKVEGKYGDLEEMARTAEDRARHAVLQLRSLPARLAPRLALLHDEIEIDALLDQEIRAVCREIEKAALAALGADIEPTAEAAHA